MNIGALGWAVASVVAVLLYLVAGRVWGFRSGSPPALVGLLVTFGALLLLTTGSALLGLKQLPECDSPAVLATAERALDPTGAIGVKLQSAGAREVRRGSDDDGERRACTAPVIGTELKAHYDRLWVEARLGLP